MTTTQAPMPQKVRDASFVKCGPLPDVEERPLHRCNSQEPRLVDEVVGGEINRKGPAHVSNYDLHVPVENNTRVLQVRTD